MILDDWNKQTGTIPLWQLMKIIHCWTDRLRIEVIIGDAWLDEKEGRRLHDFTLTEDAFAGIQQAKYDETERLLRYYADAPCWNVTANLENVCRFAINSKYSRRDGIVPVIVARVHYRDIREGYLREKEDIRREKRRASRKKAE